MNQIIRYVFFILVPYVLCGDFWVMVGLNHGQACFELRGWDFGDTLNLVIGGLPGACIGAVIERLTRKKTNVQPEGTDSSAAGAESATTRNLNS